jgi:hypothetical protein
MRVFSSVAFLSWVGVSVSRVSLPVTDVLKKIAFLVLPLPRFFWNFCLETGKNALVRREGPDGSGGVDGIQYEKNKMPFFTVAGRNVGSFLSSAGDISR